MTLKEKTFLGNLEIDLECILSSTLFTIKNLNKTYPNGVQALKNISFEVHKGEFLVIVGLSGSGKSTLLRCLNRLEGPTSGEILLDGKDCSQLKSNLEIRSLRKKVGMVFQQFNLMPRYSVLKNVLIGKLYTTSTLKSIFGFFSVSDQAEALAHLKMMGLSDKAHLRADQLSGGQQQRVAMARTLAQNPEVILADEPVASLDPATSHVIMDYLKKINQELGITIICNLHFLSLVRTYATRVIALKDGEIVFQGSPQNIDSTWFKKIYGEDAQQVSP